MRKRVLVASRGTVAVRTIAACRRSGVSPVAVAAGCDPHRLHVAAADGCAGLDGRTLADTYDSVDAIVGAATTHQVDLVHPGCGALAENPDLPRRLAPQGIDVVGAHADALARARDKNLTVATAARLGIPVLPNATTLDGLGALIAEVGLPIIVKPADGCLGAGVRVVRDMADVVDALGTYVDGRAWYAERYVDQGTVVAITVAVDAAGTVRELGERETLLLQGSFKLLDASPIVTVTPSLITQMRRAARLVVTNLGLTGVATCEFIVKSGEYFLLECNPRLSGGFRMCEAQTGLDVVSLQLGIADGERLADRPIVIDRTVHCLEARWYLRSDAIRTAAFDRIRLASVLGVAYDCAVRERCSLEFDAIVVQVLATGSSRRSAADRLLRASEDSEVRGGPRHYGADIAGWVRAADFDHAALSPIPGGG